MYGNAHESENQWSPIMIGEQQIHKTRQTFGPKWNKNVKIQKLQPTKKTTHDWKYININAYIKTIHHRHGNAIKTNAPIPRIK